MLGELGIPLSDKRIVGLIVLASLAIIRSFVYYNYVPGVVDVWHWAVAYLVLLPVDGSVSEVYGLWSREKLLAFLVGFLPSLVALVVPVLRFGGNPGVAQYMVLGLGMGLMGFGGAKYGLSRGWMWLVIGFLVWLFFLYILFFMGMS